MNMTCCQDRLRTVSFLQVILSRGGRRARFTPTMCRAQVNYDCLIKIVSHPDFQQISSNTLLLPASDFALS